MVVFNINHSTVCLRYGDIENLKFSRLRPYRPLPVVIEPYIELQTGGFYFSMGFPIGVR